jgi:hypothetical protein
MSKQGNALLRYLWTEATMHAVQKDPELRRFYRRKLIQKGMGKAKIAVARKLGDPALDHDARPDRLPRILPPRNVAADGESPCRDA